MVYSYGFTFPSVLNFEYQVITYLEDQLTVIVMLATSLEQLSMTFLYIILSS